ncbi:hypothetical protein JG688_00009421 [Phytophthora aleatoria]|uniref:Uncharacterized protein n=1 Tax=Phytophthora aleatoria TaxID=2496075 RepID=A0A8J5MFY7_9STRA|nr:hypothetical protein JG688_00009421 [Phytophthora aleatoria]
MSTPPFLPVSVLRLCIVYLRGGQDSNSSEELDRLLRDLLGDYEHERTRDLNDGETEEDRQRTLAKTRIRIALSKEFLKQLARRKQARLGANKRALESHNRTMKAGLEKSFHEKMTGGGSVVAEVSTSDVHTDSAKTKGPRKKEMRTRVKGEGSSMRHQKSALKSTDSLPCSTNPLNDGVPSADKQQNDVTPHTRIRADGLLEEKRKRRQHRNPYRNGPPKKTQHASCTSEAKRKSERSDRMPWGPVTTLHLFLHYSGPSK